MELSRRSACLALLALALMSLVACRRARDPGAARQAGGLVRVRETRMPMGTYMTVTVYAPSEEAGQKAIDAAFARVEQVEAVISTWRKDSDASTLNRQAGGEPVRVDPRLIALLQRSVEVSRKTGGAFDITVGPLVKLYRRCFRRRRLPTDDELAAAGARMGYQAIEVDAQAGTARLAKEDMRVDFGAIGKGFVVDQAVAALRKAGITTALLDAGGDLFALGSPPGRDGWLIGVRNPARPDEILEQRLLVRDVAVATSGDYEQFVVIDGRRYSHIVDPRTGRPVKHMGSVTAIAGDATTADAYATACSVLGPKAAAAFANERLGVETLILYRTPEGHGTARSEGFDRFIAPDDVTP